jgi:hypothetical protein
VKKAMPRQEPAPAPRGVSLRVDLTPDEYKAIRILAIERDTTLPRLVAEAVRKLLGGKNA